MASISETARPGFVYDAETDTWIPIGVGPHSHTPAAIGAVSSSVVTNKGDLIVGSGSGTVVRQGVGADGTVPIADSTQTSGINYTSSLGFTAGKNKLINGDFGIWQRGTSFTADGYTADRWRLSKNAGTTVTVSRQSFTPGEAPVAGYEGTYFIRYQRTAGAFDDYFLQRVEDARTFANTPTKLSFWAKASSATTISQVYAAQATNGTGGGGAGNFSGLAITTSWARYTVDITLPSLAGATFGAGNYVEIVFKMGSAMGNITVDLWGVQWEAGSVATGFQTATGTIQGELAACQRYYWRPASTSVYALYGYGTARDTTHANILVPFPVTMRTAPTVLDYSNVQITFVGISGSVVTAMSLDSTSNQSADLYCTVASGLTQYRSYALGNNNSTTAYVGFGAEL